MSFFKWVAPVYDVAMKITGHPNTLKTLIERIDPQPDEKLLDVGGGTGQLLELMPAEVDVTLVDASPDMLAKAEKKKYHARTKFIQARGDDMPLNDNTFDYVVIADALHHFTAIEETFTELNRVLKPEGTVYILEFSPESLLTKFISGAEQLAGEPGNFFTAADLAELLQKAGFSTADETLSNSLYILTGSK